MVCGKSEYFSASKFGYFVVHGAAVVIRSFVHKAYGQKNPDLNSLTLYLGVICPHPVENGDTEKKNETSSRQIGGRSCGKDMENAVNRCIT